MKAFWEETLVRLRHVPEEEILKKLRISFDDLDEYQQQIFLDIACFFFNESKTDAIYMWTACQFYPERGIDVLTSKCLIKILHNDVFWMHDQLISMGREIVRQESPTEFGKRSRLWIEKEVLEVIGTEERKDKVQALEITGGYKEITNEEFERLQNLRFLKLGNGTFAGDFAKCHSKLKWISWKNPSNFKAGTMYLDHLVVFKLSNNSLTDDSKAWNLFKLPRGISMLENLEVLILRDCHEIQELPELPTSLTYLDLKSKSLLSIPNMSNLTNLVELFLSDNSWYTRKSNPIIGCNLSWIGRSSRLRKLELNLLEVLAPPELSSLSHLEELVLRHLDLKALVQLPSSYWRLRNLLTLKIECCEVEEIPLKGLPRLKELTVEGCLRLQRLSVALELRKLQEVNVFFCQELVEIHVVGFLKSLESIFVSECVSLTKIYGLSHLKNLEKLKIDRCNVLTNVEGLDELEILKFLEVKDCTSFKTLIDASCTKIPDDCIVNIWMCGDSIKDSRWEMPSKHREEIPWNTSNKVRHILHQCMGLFYF
ncbi:hypothetical protein BT93_L2526 [Corymbia citriodora subsp. variegata]|uniref:Disease resistance protein Roq1-like winged-helix domain-containing protein n=1 Tax=Corymbia citriodora subsp. variegata TaxID=360336 RepID=A0A8T0CJM4_CORYI|nr:hypothetical protein BT93_L2526 [Corymbia citriodora subsp. variegata]